MLLLTRELVSRSDKENLYSRIHQHSNLNYLKQDVPDPEQIYAVNERHRSQIRINDPKDINFREGSVVSLQTPII